MAARQQVASLTRTVPAAVKRSMDDSIFDVGIRLSDQKTLTLRTELPQGFPRVPPILRILDPGATHPWLDSSGRVAGLSALYDWDERTSDLGQLVQQALAEFCTRPPHINPALEASRKSKESWVQTLPSPSTRTVADSPQMIQLSVPDSFPELDKFDQKQLQELLENEDAFTKFFQSLSVLSNAEQLRDSVKTGNQDKAKENVTTSKDVAAAQKRIEDLNKRVEEARRKFSGLQSKQQALSSPVDTRKLSEKFEAMARETDAQSEELIGSMFETAVLDEGALNRFKALRVLFHLRKGTADRCRTQFG